MTLKTGISSANACLASGFRQLGGRFLAAWPVVLLGGCAPLGAAPPFHLMETAEVLQAGQVGITAAGGGGYMGLDGSGGGGGLRVRVGVGARQEVGLEAAALAVDTGKADAKQPAWIGTSAAYGAKFSWKGAPLGWLAAVGGFGVAHAATGSALGGDLALVVSTPRALRGWLRPYGGVRATVAVPIDHDLYEAGGVTLGLVPAGGLSFVPARWLRLFAEAGFLNAWSSLGSDLARDDPAHRLYTTSYHGGVYGGAGATFVFGR